MKYVLGFLFEYKYYKNPANIKIFSNNQLIDEIDLTEDIKMKNMLLPTADGNTHLYNFFKKWTTHNDWKENDDSWNNQTLQQLQIPEKGFVYTLDETIVKNSIRIEVTNNNTNYSNGFMTRWSSFTIHEIFLMPTYYLNVENYIAFGEKHIQIRNSIPNYPTYPTTIPAETYSLVWPNENRVAKNNMDLYLDDWSLREKGGSFSIELPIIEYLYEKELKMLGPVNYEQLKEKEKRRLITSAKMPLYLNQLKLINTQNEAT